MSNDRYEKIRKALAMRPTPGPWEVIYGIEVFTPLGARNASGAKAAANDGWHVADCDTGVTYMEEGKEKIPYGEKKANASLIAACDPDTIRALLDERDGLASENEALQAEVGALREMMEERGQRDEALLRQALMALEQIATDLPWELTGLQADAIAALRERLRREADKGSK